MHYLHMSDLGPNITNKRQVNIMVSRTWTSYNPNTNHVISAYIILSDDRGSTIHAKVPGNLFRFFNAAYEEGIMYRIHRFVFLPYDTLYRPLHRERYVLFSSETTIVASLMDAALFPRHVFDFVPFNFLHGILHVRGPIVDKSRLGQSCNREVGNMVISNERCVCNKVAELFSYLQKGVIEQGTMYIIDATIIGVDLVTDWKYVKCSRCRKKTALNGDHYFCASCNTIVVNPRRAYKLVIHVVNKGEDLSCVMLMKLRLLFLGLLQMSGLRGFSLRVKIKIDRYNLATNYVRLYTVSKYMGDDINLLNKDKTMSTACASQVIPSNDVVSDGLMIYPPITDDEWAMLDESIWGPRVTSKSELTKTMISSCWSERMISHTGTETRPRLLREAAVGNFAQWAKA
ncbi:hypothetical protein E3N88_03962 [Mikania micrantha]|uniref:Replication protein A 70 kDa DNA-binding subunit B/D first OB fold domain-containing protein n=2 Tax=Magnoliopsida TaxID=3398 RepID=A0A5N6PT15_9ASTR|nr:hypothetical protein E3N88_03962 [Mikania micrantha]